MDVPQLTLQPSLITVTEPVLVQAQTGTHPTAPLISPNTTAFRLPASITAPFVGACAPAAVTAGGCTADSVSACTAEGGTPTGASFACCVHTAAAVKLGVSLFGSPVCCWWWVCWASSCSWYSSGTAADKMQQRMSNFRGLETYCSCHCA